MDYFFSRSFSLRKNLKWIFFSMTIISFTSPALAAHAKRKFTPIKSKRVILFIWDGLRPDTINKTDTPNLYKFREEGTNFVNHHSVYPTLTMINAQAFATGAYPGKTGYYGNTVYVPAVVNKNAINAHKEKIDFTKPVFTEDYKILEHMNRRDIGYPLLEVPTLFELIKKNGMITAAVGKSGPAFIQDYNSPTYVLDEVHIWPKEFALELHKKGFELPKESLNAFDKNSGLSSTRGNPTAFKDKSLLVDQSLTDPTDTSGSRAENSNDYLANVYMNYILPNKKPDLTVLWLRDPDTSQHDYGVGTPNAKKALQAMDKILGKLLNKLDTLGLKKSTDIVIASDHAHSNVSGPTEIFPLRKIENGAVTSTIDEINGFSTSGSIRTADLMSNDEELNKENVRAFDGHGCGFDPTLSGTFKNGEKLYEIKKQADICDGKPYTSPSYIVPQKLEENDVILAANGGTEYLYFPSHKKEIIEKLVNFYQTHAQYGVIFVSDRYGPINGTFPMSIVNLENLKQKNPDIIVSMSYNSKQKINGFPGTIFSSVDTDLTRGFHGSFSPVDVHNTLIANGPSFRSHYVDQFPTANIDVPVTIAQILKTPFTQADGRILKESLTNENTLKEIKVTDNIIETSQTVTDLKIYNEDKTVSPTSEYSAKIYSKTLEIDDKVYKYFDYAVATRK